MLIATLKWYDSVGILASMSSPRTIKRKRLLPFPIRAKLVVRIAVPLWASNAVIPYSRRLPRSRRKLRRSVMADLDPLGRRRHRLENRIALSGEG